MKFLNQLLMTVLLSVIGLNATVTSAATLDLSYDRNQSGQEVTTTVLLTEPALASPQSRVESKSDNVTDGVPLTELPKKRFRLVTLMSILGIVAMTMVVLSVKLTNHNVGDTYINRAGLSTFCASLISLSTALTASISRHDNDFTIFIFVVLTLAAFVGLANAIGLTNLRLLFRHNNKDGVRKLEEEQIKKSINTLAGIYIGLMLLVIFLLQQ